MIEFLELSVTDLEKLAFTAQRIRRGGREQETQNQMDVTELTNEELIEHLRNELIGHLTVLSDEIQECIEELEVRLSQRLSEE